MSAKEKLKKFLMPGLGLILVIAIIVPIVVININNSSASETDLTISTRNISLKVGEEKQLSYYLSDLSAKVSYSIEDPEVVEMNGNKVKGLKEGLTSITLEAELNDKTAQAVCNVVVSKADEPSDEGEPSDDDASDNDQNNDGQDENENQDGSGNENQPVIPDIDQFEFKLHNQANCEIENNVIKLNSGVFGFFRIEYSESTKDVEPELVAEEGISLSPIGMNNTWQILAEKAGRILVKINGEIIGEILVEIKS